MLLDYQVSLAIPDLFSIGHSQPFLPECSVFYRQPTSVPTHNVVHTKMEVCCTQVDNAAFVIC